jgi:hypothetical protein
MTPDIDNIYVRIVEGNITISDVNLILEDATTEDAVAEDVVDSVEDRIKRKTRVGVSDKHISHGGRQKLGNSSMSSRVNPKRQRSDHTQHHGAAKHAHDRSTKTQRRNAGQ